MLAFRSRRLLFWVSVLSLGALAPLGAVPPIVYVSRDFGGIDPARRMASDTVAVHAASGELVLYRPSDRAEVVLVSRERMVPAGSGVLPLDVADPDVSWDASRIVFSGWVPEENGWRIFTIAADGSSLEQVTSGERSIDEARFGDAAPELRRHDDLDPCWLPDGRICFVSTRYAGVAPDGRHRTTNLYVVGADGSGLSRITTERFGADSPAVDPSTGEIVYSRWWRSGGALLEVDGETRDVPPGSPGYLPNGTGGSTAPVDSSPLRGLEEKAFPGVNHWILSSIRPDGTGLKMFSGRGLDRQATQAWHPSFFADGSALALFIPETPRIGLPGQDGLRAIARGDAPPRPLGGPQSFGEAVVDPAVEGRPVPVDEAGVPEPGLPPFLEPVEHLPPELRRYGSAVPLSDGTILASVAVPGAFDHDIYVQRDFEILEPLIEKEGTAELDAVPLESRPLPPTPDGEVREELPESSPRTVEEAFERGGSFRFIAENIHFNAPIDTGFALAPPVGQKLAIEFWMSPPGGSLEAADAPLLIARQEIGSDGHIEQELPAGVPLFEILRRPDGALGVGRDGQIFHVGGMNFGRAGEDSRCVGCHAGHSMLDVPEDPRFTNLAASALVSTDSLFDLGDLLNLPPVADGDDGRDPAADDPKEGPDGLPIDAAGQVELFSADRLVDRSSATVWIGAPEEESHVRFEWPVPLRADAVVVHPVSPSEPLALPPDLQAFPVIRKFEVVTRFAGDERSRTEVTPPSKWREVRVALDPQTVFDQLEIVVRNRDIEGGGIFGPILSEVEVIAEVAPSDSFPHFSILRGDSDCDGRTTITDAIVILGHLFLGSGELCCAAAADTTNDDRVNITDAVFLLNFLFLGGPMPAHSRECGSVPVRTLDCDRSTCF